MSDIEIARAATAQPIGEIASKAGIPDEALMPYGKTRAKTQYSFSTDPNLKGASSGHVVPIREVRLSAGAGFLVFVCGEIMTMPGLPRVPAADKIHIDDDGLIQGLF